MNNLKFSTICILNLRCASITMQILSVVEVHMAVKQVDRKVMSFICFRVLECVDSEESHKCALNCHCAMEKGFSLCLPDQ